MSLVGEVAHRRAVRRLLDSYSALPRGVSVRLAKRTSNLFRDRAPASGPGLDVSGLGGVITLDPVARTADVQGMCTYEDLVSVTLAFGFIPYVVPQLRTITLGGAITGLGIEATSFRNGLPHESVLEMDIVTGAGELVTTRPGDPLFDAFPNSYGSLGYAVRVRIELEPVPGFVALRHLGFADLADLAATMADIVTSGQHEGARVDALDGVVFAPGEAYLTLARWSQTPPTQPSDYAGSRIYYRSIQQRGQDTLTMADYLWRWDTDWFWCSRAFGAQHPLIRRLWPRRFKRSDVYWQLVALDRRFGLADRLDRWARRPRAERVVQDIEVPIDQLASFLTWFDAEVGMRPVWLCPLRLRDASKRWPGYPLAPGVTYVNVGFWGSVNVGPEAPRAPRNRAIEAKVLELGGHKSLYSEAFYDEINFDRLYGGANLTRVKARYDPDNRLPSLYDKAVRRA